MGVSLFVFDDTPLNYPLWVGFTLSFKLNIDSETACRCWTV